MTWKFKFDAPVNSRYFRYFNSVTVIDDKEPLLWWSDRHNKFMAIKMLKDYSCCTHSKPVRTFKAFKRFLRKHAELQGRTVVLCSRYIGYDIIANFEVERIQHDD